MRRDAEAPWTAMPTCPREDRCPKPRTAGFTIFEAVMVLILMAAVSGALAPSLSRTLGHARVNRAANVVAANFYLAQSLASRQRAPVKMVFSPGARNLTIRDGPSDTVLFVREFGTSSEFRLRAFSATPASVLVLPNAMTSASVTVTVGGADYSRRVRMTRAGQVRILAS